MTTIPDIRFTCPHCQQPFQAPADMAGETTECPTCQKQILVPSAAPVKLVPAKKPLAGRLTAGIVGGFIIAFLVANFCTVVIGNPDPRVPQQKPVVLIVSGIVFFGLWATGIIIGLRAGWAAQAWRRLLIPCGCLCFALPIFGMILAGRMANHVTSGPPTMDGAAMLAAGGVGVVVLGCFGFFLGIIFLVVGLLVGRDKHRPNHATA